MSRFGRIDTPILITQRDQLATSGRWRIALLVHRDILKLAIYPLNRRPAGGRRGHVTMTAVDTDKTILQHIDELIAEEKTLRAAHLGHGLTGDDRDRLQRIEVDLDRTWDLLRQRRAKEEFGEDPDGAAERPGSEVEGYLQ
jgi:hypothetical protein